VIGFVLNNGIVRRLAAGTCVAAGLVACRSSKSNDRGVRKPAVPASKGEITLTGDSVEAAGLVLRPKVLVEQSRFPARFVASITATNRDTKTVRVTTDGGGCLARLRVYAGRDRNGPVVYPPKSGEYRVGVNVCQGILLRVDIPPDSTHQFVPWSPRETVVDLPDSALRSPNGQYHLSVAFLANQDLLELPVGVVELTR
jgi:hypothetical protein